MIMFFALFMIALACMATGVAIGYKIGKKDGEEQEGKKWKSENEYVKKEGVKIE
jgi:hypothetical protein